VTIRFLVTSLTKALLPQLLSLARAASSRKGLGGSKHIPFKNDGGHCVLGDFQCCKNNVGNPSPDHNPVSELYGQFFRPHGLVFALTPSVNLRPYMDRCFPFQIMYNQFNLPQVKDDQWKQDASELNFKSHSKGSQNVEFVEFL
jgi:hypothetical protein